MLPVGLLIVRTRIVGQWMGWLAPVAGSLGLFWMFAVLAGALVGRSAGVLIQVVSLAVLGFTLILGIRLLAREVS